MIRFLPPLQRIRQPARIFYPPAAEPDGSVTVTVQPGGSSASSAAAALQAGHSLDTRGGFARGESAAAVIQAGAEIQPGQGGWGTAGARAADVAAGANLATQGGWSGAQSRPAEMAAGAEIAARGGWSAGQTAPSIVQAGAEIQPGRSGWAGAAARAADLAAGAELTTRSGWSGASSRAADIAAGQTLDARGSWAAAGSRFADLGMSITLNVQVGWLVTGSRASGLQAGANVPLAGGWAHGDSRPADALMGATLVDAVASWALAATRAADIEAGAVLTVQAGWAIAGARSADIVIPALIAARAGWAHGGSAAAAIAAGASVETRGAWALGGTQAATILVPVTLAALGGWSVAGSLAANVPAGAAILVAPGWARGESLAAPLTFGADVRVLGGWAVGSGAPATVSTFLEFVIQVAQGGWAAGGSLPGCIQIIQPETLVDVLSSVQDTVRGVLAEIGIRPYRVFLVTETWTGARIGEGTVSRTIVEMKPAPQVRGSGSFAIEAAGQRLAGALTLDKISRRAYTREQLKGLTELPAARRRPVTQSFRIGVMPRGQQFLELYVPGEPTHAKYGWRLTLEPTAVRIPHTPVPIPTDTMAGIEATAIQAARQVLTDAGLRPYRVFWIREIWSGAQVGVGTVRYEFTELAPAPRVRFVSHREEMTAGGRRLEGDAVLDRFPESLTREQLRGLDPDGTRRAVNERWHYGLEARFVTDRVVELYTVASEPILAGGFGWEITIRPEGRRIPPC